MKMKRLVSTLTLAAVLALGTSQTFAGVIVGGKAGVIVGGKAGVIVGG
jgi:hypothetical protein